MSTPVHLLSDFSDRISPMLVKELRQGLRAKTFVVVFLSLQIFLAVMLFSAGAASTSDYVGSIISGIIFTFFSIAVLVVQPLRGINALSSEMKENTIDMMVLTRLSAWRIVFGKWVAIVSQSALLLSTIIPYLILRYFFGGMNLVSELVFLFLIFVTSMMLTAVTVGLSGCSSVIVRSLMPIIGIPMLMIFMLNGFFMRSILRSGNLFDVLNLDSVESRIGITCYLTSTTYIGLSLLSMGASLISPAAENHAFLRRVVALALMLTLFIAAFFDPWNIAWTIFLVSLVGVPSIIIALTDSAPLVATVCKPFVKRGPVGRFIGCFLYPTWSSGILHAILIGTLGMTAIMIHSFKHGNSLTAEDEEIVAMLSLFGGFYFPAVWQAFLFRGESQRLGHYLLLLAGSFILLGVLSILSESMNSSGFLWFFAWHPFAFLAMLSERHEPTEFLTAVLLVLDGMLLAILGFKAVVDIRKHAPIIQETRETLGHDG